MSFNKGVSISGFTKSHIKNLNIQDTIIFNRNNDTNVWTIGEDVNNLSFKKNNVEKFVITTSGISPTKMTTIERDLMSPIAGDMIYNTTTNKHKGYNRTIWNNIY